MHGSRGLSRAEAASLLRVAVPEGATPVVGMGAGGGGMAIPGLEGHYDAPHAAPPRVAHSPPRAAPPPVAGAAIPKGPLSDTQTRAFISEIKSEQDRLREQVAEQESALQAVREVRGGAPPYPSSPL